MRRVLIEYSCMHQSVLIIRVSEFNETNETALTGLILTMSSFSLIINVLFSTPKTSPSQTCPHRWVRQCHIRDENTCEGHRKNRSLPSFKTPFNAFHTFISVRLYNKHDPSHILAHVTETRTTGIEAVASKAHLHSHQHIMSECNCIT